MISLFFKQNFPLAEQKVGCTILSNKSSSPAYFSSIHRLIMQSTLIFFNLFKKIYTMLLFLLCQVLLFFSLLKRLSVWHTKIDSN